ncbi:hypothetical protein [Streptosporangium sp. NPDC087985]|uniref:hypothetical protein n=1 Tax=Streptosporangium sp. NPDC087985 TaxID=3366196 RepID=UPI003812BEA0
MIGTRVPRRFPIGDGEETVLVPRIDPDGSFPQPSPAFSQGDATGGAGPAGAAERSGSPAHRGNTGHRGNAAHRGNTGLRAAYSVAAAVVIAAAAVLTFVLFSGDEPGDSVRLPQADAATESMPPRAVPTITLPGLPRVRALEALPGTPSPVLGAVTDVRAAITYARLGKPWTFAAIPSFTVGQQVGTVRLPPTMAVSGPLPGAAPATALETGADFRKAALSAVRWTVRNHYPAGSKVAWTASQEPAEGKGWTFGYQVTYQVKGERRTSQAALALLDVGRSRPAMLFVTVPDTHKQLWADIAPLVASVRAL